MDKLLIFGIILNKKLCESLIYQIKDKTNIGKRNGRTRNGTKPNIMAN